MTTESDRLYSVRRAHWASDHELLRQIRSLVFVREQGIPVELEWDGLDATAVHLLALDRAAIPVGTARLLSSGQVGRMAVLPEWRGRGVGSALLREILSIARGGTYPTPFLHAQASALPFYLRMGFVPTGDEFEEAGIPHRKMKIGPLSRTVAN